MTEDLEIDEEKMHSRYTAFRCPEDLLRKAKIKARRDRRSLSNYLITLIEKDVKDFDISTPKVN